MADPQYYTVFIRVPIPRGTFVDPPPVNWDSTKDEALWKILSGVAQKEIDWNLVADRFEVPVDFLLQQVAYLTERHLSQFRAQVRKATAAAKGSTAPSPIPGSDSAGIGHHRTASALSIRRDSPLPRSEGSGAMTAPARPTISRNTSANTAVLKDVDASSPRIASKPVGRPIENAGRTRLSSLPVASPTTKYPEPPLETERVDSPGPADELSSTTSSDDESLPAQSRIIRRPPRFQQPETYAGYQGDDDDDESEPAFQPYKAPESDTSSHDLASTLRGDGRTAGRRSLRSSGKEPIHHSQTSDSSAGSHAMIQRPGKSRDQRGSGPLSPRRTAELSGTRGSREGSDGTPSMGSSYSDLEDASVTQSAMEEALASQLNHGAGSRFSISQAIRSRYYSPSSNQ